MYGYDPFFDFNCFREFSNEGIRSKKMSNYIGSHKQSCNKIKQKIKKKKRRNKNGN